MLQYFRWFGALFFLSVFGLAQAQPTAHESLISEWLNEMRQDVPMLRQFFQRMPKGGDLHHHFSGSIYAETLLECAMARNFWLHTQSLEVQPPSFRPAGKDRKHWRRLSQLQAQGLMESYYDRLLRKWSVFQYEYNTTALPPHPHFFSTFPAFLPIVDSCLVEGLLEIKRRAMAQHIAYVETMFMPIQHRVQPAETWNQKLLVASADSSAVMTLLEQLWKDVQAHPDYQPALQRHNRLVRSLHDAYTPDEEAFVIRYQNYVLRTLPPAQVFADLALGFASAQAESLIVGVNIVAPENHPTAMRDYGLHMLFYRFLRRKFPEVKFAVHAGELTLNLVKPEDLTWHIEQAVHVAGASRIGHGTGIAWENPELARFMAQQGIPVEINLSSNRFILGIAPEAHPLSLWRYADTPIVLCTDDEGVLRSQLSEEYVLLYRHHNFSYTQIKQLAFNALEYSFLKEPALKARLLAKLEDDFARFELEALNRWILR